MVINKETSTIMKGYAILFIALHNFLHVSTMGFVKENEMSFDISNTNFFFDHLLNPSLSILGDVFSFIGWVGVPVFVFLSGYGLTKKYEKCKRIEVKPYLKYSFFKLFWLMIPAVLFYAVLSAITGDFIRVGKGLFSLTMLNNFICNIIPFEPGVYWYFGLTFQLYIIYLFVCDTKRAHRLLLGGLCIILQFFLNSTWFPEQEGLSLVRHNFIGWLPLFLFGMGCAKNSREVKQCGYVILLTISVVALILMLAMNLNFYVWIFVPFIALAFFYSLAKLTERGPVIKSAVLWLGSYSAYIFAVHPIARTIVLYAPIKMSSFFMTVVYVIVFCIGAMIYKLVVDRLNKIIAK